MKYTPLILCLLQTGSVVSLEFAISAPNLYENITENWGSFSYDPTYTYVVLMHGLNGNINTDWYAGMIVEFLKKPQYAVITTGYPEAMTLDYVYAATQVSVIGSLIANFVQRLMTEKGIPIGNVELVAHSMGAHVAGYAGLKLGGRLPIIYGLDPASPMFEDVVVVVRSLAPSDAQNVVVLHTSVGIGMRSPCGTLDFYPNLGVTQGTCYPDHGAALYYFRCSINMCCENYGVLCSSAIDFLGGKCTGNPTALMGYGDHTSETPGLYYLLYPSCTYC